MILRIIHNRYTLSSASDDSIIRESIHDIIFTRWETLTDAVFSANAYINRKLRDYIILNRKPHTLDLSDNIISLQSYYNKKNNNVIKTDDSKFWSIDFSMVITHLVNYHSTVIAFGDNEFALEITQSNRRHSM